MGRRYITNPSNKNIKIEAKTKFKWKRDKIHNKAQYPINHTLKETDNKSKPEDPNK